MKQLWVRPQVYYYERLEQFTEEFALNGDDLLFTEQLLYDTFFERMGLSCGILCRDKYGTGEPSDSMIDAICKDAKVDNYRRIIAVGGGSVIDIAKVLMLELAGHSADLFLKRTPAVKKRELVIVPTTCGTGSEMTNISIANIAEKETKLGLTGPELFADFAVLIPELVSGLPHRFFMFSAIDALVHAAESYISKNANDYTEIFSLQACKMIMGGFRDILLKGRDMEKLLAGGFLKASNMAGIAFGNAGCGAVHALAYPLGGVYHVAHGEANYQFLEEVFQLYGRLCPSKKLEQLSEVIAREIENAGIACGKGEAFSKLHLFLDPLEPLKDLKEYGMKPEEVDTFAQSVIANQQRLLANCPIEFTADYCKEIYKRRYDTSASAI